MRLLLISPEYLQGLKFSATMPKAKNQSRRVYSLVLGVSAAVFCFFFEKRGVGDFRCFWFFLKKNISG